VCCRCRGTLKRAHTPVLIFNGLATRGRCLFIIRQISLFYADSAEESCVAHPKLLVSKCHLVRWETRVGSFADAARVCKVYITSAGVRLDHVNCATYHAPQGMDFVTSLGCILDTLATFNSGMQEAKDWRCRVIARLLHRFSEWCLPHLEPWRISVKLVHARRSPCWARDAQSVHERS
jgi:hypothetical protein